MITLRCAPSHIQVHDKKTKEKAILQPDAWLLCFSFQLISDICFLLNRDLHLILKQIAVTSIGLAQNLDTNDDVDRRCQRFKVLIEGSSGPYPSYPWSP